jgi:hypothetical protein
MTLGLTGRRRMQMAKISIKDKKLFRAMRDNGISKKKARGVLADVRGGKGKHGLHPVATVKGGVQHLRKH